MNDATGEDNIKTINTWLKRIGAIGLTFWLSAGVASAAPERLENGTPRSWLTASRWLGPAGLSLWGLDAEARTRPNPGDPCAVSQYDVGLRTNWTATVASEDGLVVLDAKTLNYSWGLGVGYAHLYLDVAKDMDCALRLSHTGIGTQGWLDGRALNFATDTSPPADFARLRTLASRGGDTALGVTDQGGKINVRLGRSAPPQSAPLKLRAGRHRLLIKMITQQPAGQVFAFMARFTQEGEPAPAGVSAQLSDPDCALELQAEARRLTSRITVDAPANLPHAGQPLKLRCDLQHIGETRPPIVPFEARLVVEVTDFDGQEVLRREITRQFPGVAEFDLGDAPDRGYYAVQATLHTPDGRLIMACVPDGFSVIGGTAGPFDRRERKKMAVTFYFMGAGAKAIYKTAFPWMTRMGIYRNIGSSPDFPIELGEAAKAAGIMLSMDFWDIHNAYTQKHREELASRAAPYTRWFKSFNEVDIHPGVRKTPEHWVARSKGECEAARKARPDAFFVGGSLVRPGADTWFTECLKLGLDQYVDAWDVHVYPKSPPVLEGSLSNSANESDRGVLACYERLKKKNIKPFWIGETGARASNGQDARCWQADTIAKMVACACSRSDFQYIGFLYPWDPAHTGTHSGPGARTGDIPVAHMPGEAAYYTASALIDGFDYTRLDFGPGIQAARFGETIILWCTGPARDLAIPLPGDKPWAIVDVVGRATHLAKNSDGASATFRLTKSPVYVLPKDTYRQLTR